MIRAFLTASLLGLAALPAAAAEDSFPAMSRVLSCKGPDAAMEVFMPQSAVKGRGLANVNLARPVLGVYTLDLTDAGKGKTLEPARISLTPDKQAVVVDQFTRKLPPTRVPIAGGTVNFDNRFGTDAKCGPFNSE